VVNSAQPWGLYRIPDRKQPVFPGGGKPLTDKEKEGGCPVAMKKTCPSGPESFS